MGGWIPSRERISAKGCMLVCNLLQWVLAALNYYALVWAECNGVVFIYLRVVDRVRTADNPSLMRQCELLLFATKIKRDKYMLITKST